MSTTTIEDVVRREALAYDVGRQMTCPVTGEILDARTAVAVTRNGRTIMTVSRGVWDEREPDLRAAFKGIVGISWDGLL